METISAAFPGAMETLLPVSERGAQMKLQVRAFLLPQSQCIYAQEPTLQPEQQREIVCRSFDSGELVCNCAGTHPIACLSDIGFRPFICNANNLEFAGLDAHTDRCIAKPLAGIKGCFLNCHECGHKSPPIGAENIEHLAPFSNTVRRNVFENRSQVLEIAA